jgi:acyl-CoA synthetase (NDP forming)
MLAEINRPCITGKSFLERMNTVEPVESKTIGKIALNEHESKKLLAEYGLPVVEEQVALSVESAAQVAETIGYPVVMKALGAKLLHKTERGLVFVDVNSKEKLEKAAGTILQEAGTDLEGFLIQPHIKGNREFVTGLFRDPQFGPVIMFGLGGIYTEALSDVVFRIAPLSKADALEMIGEIRSRKLVDDFRGEKAVDRKALVDILQGLSRIAMEKDSIDEIDINPLKITPDGKVVAVDALVLYRQESQQEIFLPPVDPKHLGAFFYPKSIAFVGISSQVGKWGHRLFTITAARGFPGDIYLVNPRGGEIAGRRVYRSVKEISGKIDLAVVTVPAAGVMELIPQFQEKGITNVLLIASGFAETGDEGKLIENKLMEEAGKAGILIIGPNTMGICNPHIKLYCTGGPVWPIAGSTAMVSQSGNMGTQLLAFAQNQGIGIRVFCGSGNEGMVTIEDFIDAFEVDSLTHTVMLYVESVKNARRFMESAKRVGKIKPIVLLKGGQTQAGGRAAASHTGAMASDSRIFNAMCKQAGIVKVEKPMDILDLSAAFSSLPLPKGNRAAIMTLGGGWGVVTADLCAEYGLDVPRLSEELVRDIDPILPSYWSKSNPVDIVGERDLSLPLRIIEMLLQWDGCDAVIHLGIKGIHAMVRKYSESIAVADPRTPQEFLDAMNQTFLDYEKTYVEKIVELMHTYGKPVFGVSVLTEASDLMVYGVSGHPYKAVFYETPERAVNAFSKMVEYQQFLSRIEPVEP